MIKDRSNVKKSFGYGIFPETDEQPSKVINAPENETVPSGNVQVLTGDPAVPRKIKQEPPKNAVPFSLGPVGKRGEPLCLAEILSIERKQGLVEPNYDETYEKLKQHGDATYLSDLQKMSVQELIIEARHQEIDATPENLTRQDLIFQIIRRRVKENGLMFGEGTLEILPDQFGFLRSPDYHYLSCPDDIYISPSQIRRFGLRKGCTVSGQIRPPKENERYFALLRVEAINHEEPNLLHSRPHFDHLTPVHPNARIVLSHDHDLDTKIIDHLIPIGFGQRGLLISPPRSGKTVLMRKMAAAVQRNHPDIYVFMLLIDERPEEATEMIRQLKSPQCEVICSFFDEVPARHIHVSEIVFEKAKRMVEYGKNVFIFLDSITRLSLAWNTDIPLDLNSLNLQAPKKLFGSARKIEGGGSLTILASVLVETENPVDDAIYHQFRGTGNLEIHFSRLMAEKRIWPAIDLHKSGTQHEEYLFSDNELRQNAELRRKIADMDSIAAMEFLRESLNG
ncbi:MAG: transcription termination factor Rho [Planctomycetaceae bacterium]|jgi:transcription termination factor Rho|nr:transcription termination factor Rho [Planctomycetaceae bacterium]